MSRPENTATTGMLAFLSRLVVPIALARNTCARMAQRCGGGAGCSRASTAAPRPTAPDAPLTSANVSVPATHGAPTTTETGRPGPELLEQRTSPSTARCVQGSNAQPTRSTRPNSPSTTSTPGNRPGGSSCCVGAATAARAHARNEKTGAPLERPPVWSSPSEEETTWLRLHAPFRTARTYDGRPAQRGARSTTPAGIDMVIPSPCEQPALATRRATATCASAALVTPSPTPETTTSTSTEPSCSTPSVMVLTTATGAVGPFAGIAPTPQIQMRCVSTTSMGSAPTTTWPTWSPRATDVIAAGLPPRCTRSTAVAATHGASHHRDLNAPIPHVTRGDRGAKSRTDRPPTSTPRYPRTHTRESSAISHYRGSGARTT